MKNEKKPQELKNKAEELDTGLKELSDEELTQVSGGTRTFPVDYEIISPNPNGVSAFM